ncbi:pali-domain-containing protein [Laetiporus sulphureus 93-53]|uniref:Pali-domain-containing protein n=1 Tax=Laetiporus sulphureus 93-53 TaxID=1314785 RepID=A0A165CBA0_9APHY|nr:pali-domain-containing protein [Laetiporus sulphureus 93-53]KZT02497.1 pali-domain-containing protein [Laetiporus sulphureus 93-53]
MGIVRPATPGFLVTLAATVLLALVTFSVPYLKSIYFLKATIAVSSSNETFTFGTLGYCLEQSNGTTCSSPHVGYSLDVNELLGDDTVVQIPNVLVKWITYALVLHIVGLILAALSAIFGLLAHVREMSMAYCSSFVSGFAASVSLVAFIFDLVLFFVTKSRIKDEGGSASLGNAVWLTLVAWLLLFFAGCFYGIGRYCIKRRPGRFGRNTPSADDRYAEQMHLDAVKAESDRKARQRQKEGGLPAFQEYEQMQPLAKTPSEEYIDDGDKIVPLSDAQNAGVGTYSGRQRTQYPGGYSQAPEGTRAVDAYYNPAVTSPAQSSIYPPQSPPQPQRQASGHSQGPSGYAASTYGNTAADAARYGYGHAQQPTTATTNYGHTAGGSSCMFSSFSERQHQNFSVPRAAANDAPSAQPFNPNIYNSTAYMHGAAPSSTAAAAAAAATTSPYYSRSATAQPDRSYTLGGGAYGTAASDAAYFNPYAQGSSSQHTTPSPAPINTRQPTMRGPRSPPQLVESPVESMPQPAQPQYSDSPPMYDAATAQPPGMWSTKHS